MSGQLEADLATHAKSKRGPMYLTYRRAIKGEDLSPIVAFALCEEYREEESEGCVVCVLRVCCVCVLCVCVVCVVCVLCVCCVCVVCYVLSVCCVMGVLRDFSFLPPFNFLRSFCVGVRV